MEPPKPVLMPEIGFEPKLTRSSIKCITNYATLAFVMVSGGRANRTPIAMMQTQYNNPYIIPPVP